tara:strand:+ start:9927 stop:11039 length:1113 start_codon:yes stop_codon:yes gene_type:complete
MQSSDIVAKPTDHSEFAELAGLRSYELNLAIMSDPDIVFVPTERVRLTAVALPLKRAEQRKASLPFAMEPLLGEPIEQTHFALGSRLEDGRYLACAVNAERVAEWVSTYASARQVMIVPDVLILPIPPQDVWHVASLADRVLVRLPDGSGFATVKGLLPVFALAEGSPECRIIIDESGRADALTSAESLVWPDRSTLLDLRQGAFAPDASNTVRTIRAATALTLAIVSATTAISGADALALQHVAHTREARLIDDFRIRFPNAPAGTALMGTIDSLSSNALGRPVDTFISTLSATSMTLKNETTMSVQDMAFEQAGNRLDLHVETDSLDTFQSLSSRLAQSGITAELGAATVVPGGAEGLLSIMAKDGIQ